MPMTASMGVLVGVLVGVCVTLGVSVPVALGLLLLLRAYHHPMPFCDFLFWVF
jgi:hypothetical protein